MSRAISLFIRLMRPIFGYIVAISWGMQMLAVAFVILFKTQDAPSIINAMSSLSTTWAVGLSVLGIYVYRRKTGKRDEGEE